MTTKLQKAQELFGKTILLDEWYEGFTMLKTLRIDLAGKVPRDLIYQVWSWPEQKEHFCVIGEFTWIQNGALIERSTKAIVYHKYLPKLVIEDKKKELENKP